jgi:diacylglycerol kinase family enzyme
VAAVGGDGTVHEVVNGLMSVPAERRPLLAAVPIGSGNDFCHNFGIPSGHEQAMQRILHGEPHPIDIGRITDGSGGPVLGQHAGRRLRRHRHHLLTDAGCRVCHVSVGRHPDHLATGAPHADQTDHESFDEPMLMVTVCNGPREGGFQVAPGPSPTTGYRYAMIEGRRR